MPAVTADTLTLPKLPPPDVTARRGPVVSVTTAPQRFEGEGFPVRRAFAGVDLRRPRPVHPHGPDGRGRLRAVRAEGHRLAPAPRASRPSRTSSTARSSTRTPTAAAGHHQRRDAVDDRRRRILHIETPPEELVVSGGLFHGIQLWVNLPARGQDDRPALPEPRGRPVDAAVVARRRRARAPDRRRRRRPRRPGRARTRRSPWPTPPCRPGARLELPWRPDFNALAYVLAGSGTRRHRAPPGRRRSARPCSATATRSTSTASGSEPLEVLLLGGRPIREPVAAVRPVRDEHPGRAGAGGRRLQRRPAGHDPRRRPAAVPPVVSPAARAPRKWCWSGWPTAAMRTSYVR